jgi:hypothetical protein
MKKIITLSVLSLTVLLATACGTATETDTDSSPDTKTAEVGSCMVSATGSCQDYEDLSGVTSEDLKKDCGIFGTWSDAKCPADYSVGCKTESQQDISGKGTYTLFTMYTKDNSFVDNFKSGCSGEWIEK